MRRLGAILLFLTFSFFLVEWVNSENIAIGVSPSIIDLGNIERDTDELVKFNIISPHGEKILVYLEIGGGNFNFFSGEKYGSLSSNYSEENPIPWLKVLNNPVEMKETDEDLANGNVRMTKEVDLILKIPKDAEPGYHLLSVIPTPKIRNDVTGQVGTQMVAVSPIRILFNVPGEAMREAKILDISSVRSGDRLRLDTYLLNSGTVTISARATEILIRDEEGNLVGSSTSNVEYIMPGEIKTLKAYVPFDGIEPGTYNVFVDVDYMTGSTRLNSVIKITEAATEKMTGDVYKPEIGFNWWFLIIPLFIILAILIYRWLKS